MIPKKQEWNKNKEKWGFGRTHIDNFLDEETVHQLYEECMNAPKGGWTVFTRAGSRMEEFNDFINCPTAHKITYSLFHSGEFLYNLEQLTNISGLMPDPHLVGAGFSIIREGDNLGCHYDFNWNDRLRIHRKLTSILYISPNWKDEWGGNLEYYDDNVDVNDEATLIHSATPLFNRFVVSENVKEGPYHRVKKISSPGDSPRCAIRFFYYISDAEYKADDPPHRSIYKSNEYTHTRLYK